MALHRHSALHFLLTATMALRIKHVFFINSDEEVFYLAFFVQIIYRCPRFIFITTVLKNHFVLVPQKHSKCKKLLYAARKRPH
jgi:hypothetical protein